MSMTFRPMTCKRDLPPYLYPRKYLAPPQIVPLRPLVDKTGSSGGDAAPLYLEALSNGPTLAFKDMAMQLLGNLFEYELANAAAKS
jgi:threonine synthase